MRHPSEERRYKRREKDKYHKYIFGFLVTEMILERQQNPEYKGKEQNDPANEAADNNSSCEGSIRAIIV